MAKFYTQKACPRCDGVNCVSLYKASFECEKEKCDFKVNYSCPICNDTVSENSFTDNEHSFTCKKCASEIRVEKILNLVDQGLITDPNMPCEYCQGPTIHRPGIAHSHRCFFYPSCSGQGSLFAEKKESLIFLDFETTGLEAGRNEIIEIGACKIDEDGIEKTMQTLIKPELSIPPKITQITGITNEMVAEGTTALDGITRLRDFIQEGTIVAHNADFDLPWYVTACMKHNLEIPNNSVVCTYKWAKQNKEPRCSLGKLAQKYNILLTNAHRALADAVATKDLYLIMENQKTSPKVSLDIAHYTVIAKKLLAKYQKIAQR